MLRLLAITCLCSATASFAQSRIDGAQTSNARVVPPAGDNSSSANNTTNSSGGAHIALKPTAPRPSARPEPAILNAPTTPSSPVDLSEAAFAPLIVHREAAIYPSLARSTHARGAVVVDVVLDEKGHLESAEPIGAQDLSMACMSAIQSWKFAPYSYKGQPWKVSGSVRFTFTNPQKGTSD